MNPNSAAFAAMKKKVETTEGNYLRASDCKNGRKIRPIEWIKGKELIFFHVFYLGWQEVSKKDGNKTITGSQPLRLEADADGNWGCDESVVWAMSQSKPNFPAKRQIPEVALGMLVADHQTQTIKFAEFTQKTISGPLMSAADPKDTNMFVQNWATTDFVIDQGADNKYTVNIKEGQGDIPWLEAALKDFRFSWEDLMLGKDPFAEGAYTYQDVCDQRGDRPAPGETAEASTYDPNPKWKDYKTPGGVLLGSCNLEKLQGLAKKLEDAGKAVVTNDAKDLCYRSILTGIDELSPKQEEETVV